MTKTVILDLEDIAEAIHSEWIAAKDNQVKAWTHYFKVGTLLREARRQRPGKLEYGAWLDEQDFGFNSGWARRLMICAEHKKLVLETWPAIGTNDSALTNVPGVDAVYNKLPGSLTFVWTEGHEASLRGVRDDGDRSSIKELSTVNKWSVMTLRKALRLKVLSSPDPLGVLKSAQEFDRHTAARQAAANEKAVADFLKKLNSITEAARTLVDQRDALVLDGHIDRFDPVAKQFVINNIQDGLGRVVQDLLTFPRRQHD